MLIPSHFSGMIYDLLELVMDQLRLMNADAVPVFFLSEYAKESLAFANVYSSW